MSAQPDSRPRIDITLQPEAARPAPVTKSAPKPPRGGRQFLSCAAMILIAVLVVRALFVEPFSVATGSMAPVLIGTHRGCDCPRCGYLVRVGSPHEGSLSDTRFAGAACPNCGYRPLGLERADDVPGDRLLVDKAIFGWRRPRRWEMVVFRLPDGPDKPVVKRAVGLPGEAVAIHDGDVFIDGLLARKSLSEGRAMRVPVYDGSFVQKDGSAGPWRVEPTAPGGVTFGQSGNEIHILAAEVQEFRWLAVRPPSSVPGGEVPVEIGFGYHGGRYDLMQASAHDFHVTCDVEVLRGTGEFAISLADGADTVRATLPAAGPGNGVQVEATSGGRVQSSGRWLRAGHTIRVEFAFVDRTATLALDGTEITVPLDLPPVADRPAVTRPLCLGARGVDVVVRQVRLYRDVHYTSAGRHAVRGQYLLDADEYFVLGDNSADSEDSRFWTRPSVAHRMLLGRPLFLHHPSRPAAWSLFGQTWQSTRFDTGRVGWLR